MGVTLAHSFMQIMNLDYFRVYIRLLVNCYLVFSIPRISSSFCHLEVYIRLFSHHVCSLSPSPTVFAVLLSVVTFYQPLLSD